MGSLSGCLFFNWNLRVQVSSPVRRLGPPLVFSATQKITCSASRWLSMHVPPMASVFLFFNWKQPQFKGESKRQTCSECSSAVRVHEKKIAEMWKWWPFFPWFLRSSSSRFSKSAIILSLLHMAPFPAAPVSQCDRRMLDKISLQATETEESIWPGSKVCENQRRHSHVHRPALNADSILRKKFFVFLVASAMIEASSRRKMVSFTGPKRWQHSTKKVLHFPRRQCDWSELTTQNGVFHIQHSLRVW